jgi:SAM-dependent methyltransferase
MNDENIYEHLICPDCQTRLEMHEHLRCKSCDRIFPVNGNFINLLPLNLSQSDLAEERFWTTNPREGVKSHPLLALVVKRDNILYFYEQILPCLRLQGKVLEIGSGSCWLSALIKLVFPEVYVVASDVAPSALMKGMQVSKFLGSKIDYFVACKVEQLPFENDFFDYVIGSAILHHTSPQQAIRQIFRVLKNHGTYIGIGELIIPKPLGLLWGRFGLAGRREKELGVKEGNYSFNQWKRFFNEAGFKEVTFNLERDPQYKQYHWFINLYYKMVSRLPESLVRHCLACSIGIIAKKKV